MRALTGFALRFSAPTAVLGALFIPTPNSGGVSDGTLPDAPGVRFHRDGPAGLLRLTARAADGTDVIVVAQSRRGVYVDTANDQPIGRDLGDRLYLDQSATNAAFATAAAERGVTKPAVFYRFTEDDPRVCPDPIPDTPHGATPRALDYEDDVHQRVNPAAPLPRNSAVMIIDPNTGRSQFPDDCFRTQGDLVDGDMKAGDFVSAKGPGYAKQLQDVWIAERVMDDIVDQTERYVRAAKVRGARVKIYFAEEKARDLVEDEFKYHPPLKGVVLAVLPASQQP